MESSQNTPNYQYIGKKNDMVKGKAPDFCGTGMVFRRQCESGTNAVAGRAKAESRDRLRPQTLAGGVAETGFRVVFAPKRPV
jgi:hypothetical protein